jgi:hypothetical protein
MTNTLTHHPRFALASALLRPVFWVCPKRFANGLDTELNDRREGESGYGVKETISRSFFLREYGRWGRFGDERGFDVLSCHNRSLRSRLRFAFATALALLAFQVYPFTNEKEGY